MELCVCVCLCAELMDNDLVFVLCSSAHLTNEANKFMWIGYESCLFAIIVHWSGYDNGDNCLCTSRWRKFCRCRRRRRCSLQLHIVKSMYDIYGFQWYIWLKSNILSISMHHIEWKHIASVPFRPPKTSISFISPSLFSFSLVSQMLFSLNCLCCLP